jgi:lariat debranching enzyme
MLMKMIKPDYWFSAHLHVKYAAVYNHQITTPKPVDNPDEINLSSSYEDEEDGNTPPQESPKITKFLALDKCLPKRQFLQVLELPESNEPYKIQLDAEWLSIVKATSSFTPFTRDGNTPKVPTQEQVSRAISQARKWVDEQGPSLLQPPSFCMTADALSDDGSGTGNQGILYYRVLFMVSF